MGYEARQTNKNRQYHRAQECHICRKACRRCAEHEYVNSTLPNVHAENEQRKQQRRAKKHIERRIFSYFTAQCTKSVIAKAKGKACQY